MREEIGNLYMKVGLKNLASVFLISDAQIPDESILMLINDLLASGEIPELFNDDQLDTITNGIRNEVKQSGTLDTKENCWRYFVEKVRRLLKVVLCFSPVGQTLRVRARKFPAIISRTAIDWFHEWPKSALESVSQKFLNEINGILEVSVTWYKRLDKEKSFLFVFKMHMAFIFSSALVARSLIYASVGRNLQQQTVRPDTLSPGNQDECRLT